MHALMLTVFCLLVSVSGYAADMPFPPSSGDSSKQELAIQENNILTLSEPTENGIREHRLNLEDNEMLAYTPYKELIDDETKKGMPAIFCVSTHLKDDGEPHSQVYDWSSLRSWYREHKTNPLTRQRIIPEDHSYFLVRPRPADYKATFLFTGERTGRRVRPLNETLDLFNEKAKTEPSNPTVTKAAFYASLAQKYTSFFPHLVLKFSKFGLEGIQDEAQGPLIPYISFLLRTSGNIHQQSGNINTAIELYRKGISLNDSFSFRALKELSINLSNDEIQQTITLFETKAAAESDPVTLDHIYKNIIPLYEKIGNQEAADTTRKKITDLENSLKRQRPRSLTQGQNNLQVTPKRARFSTQT